MTFYEKVLRQMFEGNSTLSEQKYNDKTMLAKLGDDLRVKIQMSRGRVADHHNGLSVSVINRTEGTVDQNNFTFSSVLGTFNDPVGNITDIQLWDYRGNVSWYGYTPTDAQLKSVADAVTDYVSMYLPEDMEMTM